MLLDERQRRAAAHFIAATFFIAALPSFVTAAPRSIVAVPRRLGSPVAIGDPKRDQALPAPASCSISGRGGNFETIDGFDSAGATVTALLTVACSGNVAANIRLCDSHAGPGDTFTLDDGASAIHFTLGYYVNAPPANRVNDCAMPGIPLNGEGVSATYRLIGTIPAHSGPFAPGAYADTITATVIY